MKLVDANLLIYAVDRTSTVHEQAREWFEDQLNGSDVVALPWLVLLSFIRLTTKPTIFLHPLTVTAALDMVDGWLSRESVVVPQPGRRHSALMRRLLTDVGTGGNLVSDAHLAALAIEHGYELCSRDADFSRFTGLRWVNPLSTT